MQSIHQVLSQCPSCHVEAALVELYDPQQRVGVALEGRCRLCGYEAEYGETRQAGQRFESVFEVMAALDLWSAQDGEDDVRQFTAANFQGLTPEQVAERVLAGTPVETGFDVIAWLFPNAGAMGAEVTPSRPPQAAKPSAGTPYLYTTAQPSSDPDADARRREDARKWQLRPPEKAPGATVSPTVHPVRYTPTAAPETPLARGNADPQAVARALVSVMMADGLAHPAERKFVESFLRKRGEKMPPEEEWRVWRPPELGWVDDPAGLVATMREVALVDGEVDGSEIRVILEYARAWRVPFSAKSLPRSNSLDEIRRSLLAWFD